MVIKYRTRSSRMIVTVGCPCYHSSMFLLGLQLIIISLLVIHHDNNSYALALAFPSQRKRSSGGGFGSRHPRDDGSKSSSNSESKSSQSNSIQVSVAKSFADMQSLADLRYQEWIVHVPKDDYVPSRPAFRMATAEIHQERSEEHAVTFLARLRSIVVGAAELSPIELQGCFHTTGTNNNVNNGDTEKTSGTSSSATTTYNNVNNNYQYWYVTDVVTARTHRRMGVAKTLMEGLEQYADKVLREEVKQQRRTAASPSASSSGMMQTVFLLHVKPDNDAALGFYRTLGYKDMASSSTSTSSGTATTVDDPCIQGLNVDQLAENAGVEDQYLLIKTLAAAQ